MDILSRLGAHAIGTASTVKPIVAPLFLPGPRLPNTLSGIAGDLVEHDQDTPIPATTPPPIDRLEPLVEMPPRLRKNLPPHGSVERREDGQTRHDAERSVHAPEPIAGPIERTRPNPAVARPIDAQPATAIDLPVRAASDGPVSELRPVHEITSQHAATASHDAARPSPSAQTPLVRLALPRSDAHTLLDQLRSLRENAPAIRRDPVVRVTIGRIEVRATPPAVPEPAPLPHAAPPAPIQPPRLSLAEYLERKRDAR